MNKTIIAATLVMAALTLVGVAPVKAASTNLVTIPTPVVQGFGDVQLQDTYYGRTTNSYTDAANAQVGVLPHVQVQYTRDLRPGNGRSSTIDAKMTIFDTNKFKVGVGTLGFQACKIVPQTYAVAGYYASRLSLVAGAVRITDSNYEGIVGGTYALTRKASLQIDYRTGQENFTGAGINYTVGNLSVEPAVLRSNSSNTYFGYVSASLSTRLF